MVVDPRVPISQRVSALLAVMATVTGVAVVSGWLLKIDILTNVFPGLATMKFNTAMSFVLTGAALYTVQQKHADRLIWRVGMFGAALTLMIALLTILQYMNGWNLGIDQMIVRDHGPDGQSVWPGRMSPGTAVGLVVVSLALLSIEFEIRPGWRPSQFFALLSILIGGAALLGYMFGTQRFHTPIFSTMAVHTALLLLILGVGILLARAHDGIMEIVSSDRIGARMARFVLPAVVLIPFATGWLSLEGLTAGHYQVQLGFALSTLAAVVILSTLVWIGAHWINRAEDHIHYLSRIYAVLSGINTLIVRVRDQDKLFSEAARIAVEVGKVPAAWIGSVGGNVEHLKIAPWRGDHEHIADVILEQASECMQLQSGRGLVARAIADRKACVCNDVTNDLSIQVGEALLTLNIKSLIVLPLIVNDEVKAIFTLYSEQKGFFDDQEVALLVELSSDIAFAMGHIEKAKRLDFLANFDTVTGLPNRALMRDRLNQALQLSRRSKLHPAVLFVDLDRFKLVNNSLGHAAGDVLLAEIAQRLVTCVREIDTVSSVGADEFVIVLSDVSSYDDTVEEIATRILREVHKPVQLTEGEAVITCSIGIAMAPEDGDETNTLLQHAEAAMRRIKEQDGNGHERFNAQHDQLFQDRLALESALRLALDREELSLHYQPIIDLSTGSVMAVEALVRWQHPEFGLVPPARFISIAEETGLILPIGEWVLRTACTRGREWPNLQIAVNLSARQFRDEGLVTTIAGILQETGFDPGRLELELTETMLMYDVDSAIQTMNEIRAMGVRISLDDFGTGYSSLNHLKRLPVDTVKIDQTFIQDVTADAGSRAISDAIIAMSHSLELTVLAEGVETQDQLSLLSSKGCDKMQGYLFSKALPADELERLLRNNRRLDVPEADH